MIHTMTLHGDISSLLAAKYAQQWSARTRETTLAMKHFFSLPLSRFSIYCARVRAFSAHKSAGAKADELSPLRSLITLMI